MFTFASNIIWNIIIVFTQSIWILHVVNILYSILVLNICQQCLFILIWFDQNISIHFCDLEKCSLIPVVNEESGSIINDTGYV